MQSHQDAFGSEALKNRGHRRSDTLGKAMPITSLLLNYTSPSALQNFDNIRSDADNRARAVDDSSPTRNELPPQFFPVHDIAETSKTSPTDIDDDLDGLDQDYEILISECSSSYASSSQHDDGGGGGGDRRKSNSDEYISLIGNSTFYTPCQTCVGSAPSDMAARPLAINEMCRRLCTEECRLRLSLAGLVPTSESIEKNKKALETYVQHAILEKPPKLPPRPKKEQDVVPDMPKRPMPGAIAIQRKKFLNNILAPNGPNGDESISSSDNEDDKVKGAMNRPPKELMDIVSNIVMVAPPPTPAVSPLPQQKNSTQPSTSESATSANSETTNTTNADHNNTLIDPHEMAMLKDFREKFEIAEALAKTSAMTSTSQIKQRLAARKREIELENANAIMSGDAEHDFELDVDANNCSSGDTICEPASTGFGGGKELSSASSKQTRRQQGAPAITDAVTQQLNSNNDNNNNKSNVNNKLTQRQVDTGSSSVRAAGAAAVDYQEDYEPPRELLLYLVRMGSFNSAPKINNVDSQDDGLDIPKGLSTSELLQHVKHLRGLNQPPLLSRYFLKPMSSIISSDLTDGLRCLKLNSVSRVCSAPISDPNHIRLLQWNLLSQTLGQNNDGFVRCPVEALTWENRKYLIVQEILQHNPDILCLQEVDHFKFLQTILGTQNYEGIFFPKPDSPCLYIEENNGPDGCAIFFKRDKFELRNFDTRILEVWRVQSNQVAIAVNLIVKQTGRELCVCTTHLKARHGSLLSKLRNEQGRDLIRFVKQFAGDRAVILCGDFNAEPTEPVYETILNCEFMKLASAYAEMRAESDECNNASTKDSMPAMNGCDKVQKSIQNEPPYTTWKIREDGEECHTIDYVFYTKDQLKVKNCLEFPQGDEIGLNRTPSFQYPSDHFSLICDFEVLDSSQESSAQQQSQQEKNKVQ
ncbi:nocturnin [Musca vetustissima]|uniref:nocturnin n=1 Tax=Musca vetustissima TaxID=27455 RepID=UPI002AB6A682|nr:nocturnin [Musca vetustissima]